MKSVNTVDTLYHFLKKNIDKSLTIDYSFKYPANKTYEWFVYEKNGNIVIAKEKETNKILYYDEYKFYVLKYYREQKLKRILECI